jgi:hypothetical protein
MVVGFQPEFNRSLQRRIGGIDQVVNGFPPELK